MYNCTEATKVHMVRATTKSVKDTLTQLLSAGLFHTRGKASGPIHRIAIAIDIGLKYHLIFFSDEVIVFAYIVSLSYL